MLQLTSEFVQNNLDYKDLISELRTMFLSNYTMPLRHHHFYETASKDENTLILMPSWNEEFLDIKQVIVAPKNSENNLPSITAHYTLSDTKTGQLLASMRAEEITSIRTACTSALVADILAPENSKTLLIVGIGKVSHQLAQAHMVVRNYEKIYVWGRNIDKTTAFVDTLIKLGYPAFVADDLAKATNEADVISTATLSPTPIIKGEWIKPGTHLDLIGSHKPDTREIDDDAIRLGKIYVDSYEGAIHETGELAIPLAQGIISKENIVGNIKELLSDIAPKRNSASEITIFKSAGLAIEDLASAILLYKKAKSLSDS